MTRSRSTGRSGRRRHANVTTGAARCRPTKAGVMTGYRTRWVRPPEQAEDPEPSALRGALAFGKAVYDQRRALGLSTAELAGRADMTADEIECIEEGGTEPTIALLRRRRPGRRRAPDRRTRPRLGMVRTPRSLTRPARPSPARSGLPSHTATHVGSRHSTSALWRQVPVGDMPFEPRPNGRSVFARALTAPAGSHPA